MYWNFESESQKREVTYSPVATWNSKFKMRRDNCGGKNLKHWQLILRVLALDLSLRATFLLRLGVLILRFT